MFQDSNYRPIRTQSVIRVSKEISSMDYKTLQGDVQMYFVLYSVKSAVGYQKFVY